ncbi:transcription initiation factor TFIID subunit 3-like [Hydractinia symbiolongicarpus]|uniref:transcription initiation factor TFIID subunit 3-like n=1 Tax=Hydractinia symbiolongicarpus TaxID=13093 RepID=UPI002549D60B|nr:transcription initiation factor TFIID subunit 3-like [Hydractinia symbiolongicarpus]
MFDMEREWWVSLGNEDDKNETEKVLKSEEEKVLSKEDSCKQEERKVKSEKEKKNLIQEDGCEKNEKEVESEKEKKVLVKRNSCKKTKREVKKKMQQPGKVEQNMLKRLGLKESAVTQMNEELMPKDFIDDFELEGDVLNMETERLRKYFDTEAWEILRKKVEELKNDWSCLVCREPKYTNMIACDGCNIWFHWECVDFESEKSEEIWRCECCSEAEKVLSVSQ